MLNNFLNRYFFSKLFIIASLGLCLLPQYLSSQNQKTLDSLSLKLNQTAHDTTRALTLMAIGEEYWDIVPLKAIEYIKEAVGVAQQNLSESNGTVRERFNEIIYTGYNNIGFLYKINGNLKLATDNYFKGLKFAEECEEDAIVAQLAHNIGALYKQTGNYNKAFEFYERALAAARLSGNKNIAAYSFSSIGSYYSNYRKDTASAMQYYRKALDVFNEINHKSGAAVVHNNIGFLYLGSSDFPKAIRNFLLSLELEKASNDRLAIGTSYNNLGKVYLKMRKADSALYYYKEAEAALGEKKYPEVYGATMLGMYKAFKQKKNFEKAVKYLEEYKIISDSLNSSSNREELLKTQMRHDFEKKEALMKIEQDNKDALASAESRKQKIILWSVCGILFLALAMMLMIYRNYKEKKRTSLDLAEKNKQIHHQKQMVEEKQKEIVDSIQYAEKIQKTLLANHELVNKTIPDSFVVFKPKDIVSGDFYWATKKDNRFYLAVCDSTGHGVPGAFMSLLNISFLNEAVIEKNIEEPNEIFEHVRMRLVETISQDGRKDGMDGILLCLNSEKQTASYAAANNAPILISGNQITKLPFDKMPVGKGEKKEVFRLFEINAKKSDMLYLYTDGYADQFGGPKGKKFKYKQLEELLLRVNKMKAGEQSDELNEKFEEWKGSLEQIDDVCVLGIRL